MPTIAMFLGIIIKMQWDDHNPPHFHAEYQDYKALFTFDGEILEGDMPTRQKKFIAAWAEMHKQELEEDWADAWAHKSLTTIRGLR